MNFKEALDHLLMGKLIQIKDRKWVLTLVHDKNLEVKTIYISTNDYAQAWNPQEWQLISDEWEIIK